MNLCITRSNKYSYSETFIDNQIKALKPTVLLWEGWYPSVLPNGKSFLPFPLNHLLVRGSLRNLFPNFYHQLYTKSLANYLQEKQIDVLLANYGPMGVALADACLAANIKFYVHFHGFDASEQKTIATYQEKYKVLFEKVNGVIVVSNDMKEKVRMLGAKPEKIFLNPYGVDISQFYESDSPQKQANLIAVGRFTEKKAPYLTIQAFAEVIKKYPEAKLIMIGDGELWEQSKELAKNLGIYSSIDFQGKRTPSQIAEALREALVFVQHSKIAPNGDSEGTPNTVLEASATGLPIISTRHAGIKDAVVHGETGYLVEEGDWEAMAEYMIKLIEDPSLARKMGKAARKHIEENYEMSKRVQTLKEILEK